jgi:hypothetical protein
VDSEMKEPWKLDTNNKYSEVIKSIFGLSTASLLLPVFLARNILGIKAETSLTKVFSWPVYTAWVSLAFAILLCILYQYLSAKWIRLAWGKPAGILWDKNTSEKTIETLMEICFWGSVLAFFIGLFFTVMYFAGYSSAL